MSTLATWSELRSAETGSSTTHTRRVNWVQPIQSWSAAAVDQSKASSSLIEEETAHVPSFQEEKKKKQEKTQLPNCHSGPNQAEAGGYWNRKALCFFAFRVFQNSSELRKLGKWELKKKKKKKRRSKTTESSDGGFVHGISAVGIPIPADGRRADQPLPEAEDQRPSFRGSSHPRNRRLQMGALGFAK